uniref:Uncharacterized protein n=1 Tax=Salmo trutta TaxID=8032 RepID=A0A673XWW3_SALTR
MLNKNINATCNHLIGFTELHEITPEGRRITKLDQILLNGNNITMVVGEGLILHHSC